MSYCRWSSDDFKSDIYAYETDGGYEILVADNRVVGECPHLDWSTPKSFVESGQKQREFLATCERTKIGLPFDGGSFFLQTAQEFRDKLLELRSIGYYVPQEAIDRINEEIQEEE